MIFGLGILATALLLSAVAAYYSVAGLTAIFSAATIPVIIMGGSLELGKIVATVWLHNNWRRAGIVFKLYLIPAVAFLMLLTSMGIFGYLSKAHSDQSLVSGDSMARVAIYDEKIKISRENIDANRKALRQMDEAVDQVMARSSDEKGADKAVALRRGQQRERARLLLEIEGEQKKITALNEERAPLAAEFRKIEADVGPIKYIAALVYGDNTDSTVLERAVRLVIIMIVLVFDPLALTLILAANKQFEWVRAGAGAWHRPAYEPDDGPLTPEQVQHIQDSAPQPDKPRSWIPSWLMSTPAPAWPQSQEDLDAVKPPAEPKPEPEPYPTLESELADANVIAEEEDDDLKAAMKAWKAANPNDTLKAQRVKLARGIIKRLPWEDPFVTAHGFGNEFPSKPTKGDTYLRVDIMPSRLYKYNGNDWILVDKNLSEWYAYQPDYVDWLIAKLGTGEYDADLLADVEREQIALRLNQSA